MRQLRSTLAYSGNLAGYMMLVDLRMFPSDRPAPDVVRLSLLFLDDKPESENRGGLETLQNPVAEVPNQDDIIIL